MRATTTTDERSVRRLGHLRISAPAMLRTASIVTLLFAAGHSLGGLQSWSPPGETEVLQAMRSFRFDAEGVSRTYWEFYIGFGFMVGVFLLAQAAVLWQLSTAWKKDSALVRPILGVLFISVVANAALAWLFFFTVPLIMASTIALSVGLALAAALRQSIQR
jgi:hypothetical protein